MTETTALIDVLLPRFDFRERHEIEVRAPAEVVLAAALLEFSQNIFITMGRSLPMVEMVETQAGPVETEAAAEVDLFTS